MSLNLKIMMANSARVKKGIKKSLPYLKQVEPQSYSHSSMIKWRNNKLDNKYSITIGEVHEICDSIRSGELKISSAQDVANLLEVPFGQLIKLLYRGENTYKTFSIPKKMVVQELYLPRRKVLVYYRREQR